MNGVGGKHCVNSICKTSPMLPVQNGVKIDLWLAYH